MPIQHAVLALLTSGESYGYELKTSFEQSVGPQWGEFNIGHLYQVLDRLLRDGLVTRRALPQVDRPDKWMYRLTEAGQAELERWLATPFVRQSGYRDDFFLKLVAAARLGPDSRRTLFRVQREAYLAELSSLGELRTEHADDPVVSLLLDAAVFHTEANLKVLERAEHLGDALVPAAEDASVSTAAEQREAG